MKKFIFGFILLFSFIFKVTANELDLSYLGYASCLDLNDSLSYSCNIDSLTGDVVYDSSHPTQRVSNYFLVSDGGYISMLPYPVSGIYVFYYDSNYNFISRVFVSVDNDIYPLVLPSDSFYARIILQPSSSTRYITDDLNGVSSLNYAINSLSHTVSQTLTIITTNTILLIATAIFVIGICLYLIWRIIRGG